MNERSVKIKINEIQKQEIGRKLFAGFSLLVKYFSYINNGLIISEITNPNLANKG